MLGERPLCLVLVHAVLAGCTTSALPVLPSVSASPPPKEEASQPRTTPPETVIIVPGTPTEIYTQVARGALRCWFAAEGPLKTTHVYHAEAQPPASGGSAEIVVHEREEEQRDKRGPRAFRVLFSTEQAAVRVAVSTPRMEKQLADVMTRDVESWTKGGGDCGLRRPMPALTPVADDRAKAASSSSPGRAKKAP
jgi:hypothetical protein